jgi:predicted porin
MKTLGFATAVAIATFGLVEAPVARAADLPTKKEEAPPQPTNCFSSLWAYMNSTAAECPLSWGPFTAYATLDLGLGYESNGAPWSPWHANGVANFISKESYGPKWLWTPNGINQSVVGVAMKQPIAYGWSLVGTLETAFDPINFNIANGQRSLVQNNGQALLLQSYNNDSSRSGQFDNSQGFIGLSNPTYGTLVGGRVNSLPLDALISYDPMGSAYAFSAFGASSSYAGFGDSELGRSNTALKYRLELPDNLHVAGLAQIGGYDQGNGSTLMYQGEVGGDFKLFGGTPFAGTLSVDAIGAYAQNAVNLSTFTGTCATITKGAFKGETACTSGIPNFYGSDDLKATLSSNTGALLLGKYRWNALTLSGGWEYIKQADPSSAFPDGFRTGGGFNVPGTIPSTVPDASKLWPTQWISYNTYAINRIANTFFFGGKYQINPQLSAAAAFYYLEQNNYNSSTTRCGWANTTFTQPDGNKFVVSRVNSSSCAGSQDAISFMIDYQPVKRVDLYAGVMISNVYAGLASGYPATQDIAPTAGLRVKF